MYIITLYYHSNTIKDDKKKENEEKSPNKYKWKN